jgi:MFS transporter, DHA2 family, multidrug resistance protein
MSIEIVAARPLARRWQALAVTALALTVVGLDTTVLNVALPTLAVDLGATTSQLQWMADAYLLVLAAALLPAGMAGDRFGRRNTMLLALAVFGGASVWCAYAGSPASLIAARALLGLGAALLTPLTFSLIVLLFAPGERSRALAILGSAAMIGMPLGPIVGGWLLQHFWWGSVFLLNVPFAAIALLGAALLLPGEPRIPHPPMDGPGIVLSGAGLLGVTYGLIEGPGQGWGSAPVLGTIAGGLLALGMLVPWEHRVHREGRAEPVLDVALWRAPEFRWGALAASAATLVGIVAIFSTPQYLQGVLGTDALGTGLRLLPLLAGMFCGIAAGVGGARLAGSRRTAAAGFGIFAAGAVLGSRTGIGTGYGWAALWLTVFGLGFGVVMIVGQNLAVNTLSVERAGAGGALVQVLRQVGSVLGIAALGSVLNSVYRSSVDLTAVATALPAGAAATVRDSFQGGLTVATRIGSPQLGRSVREAFVAGLTAQLWVTAALAGLCLIVTLWRLPDGSKERDHVRDRHRDG